jgi:hypothetical protein
MLNKQNIDISKINTVITFGCSFSDYMYDAETIYGEVVAKRLNAKYLHHGVGGGSNHRMWRVFFDYARKGLLNENTLVTVQWTDLIRKEILSGIPVDYWLDLDIKEASRNQNSYDKEYGSDDVVTHNGGTLFKFKLESHKWHTDFPEVQKYMELTEKNFVSEKWSHELYNNYNFSIKEYCKHNNIPLVFIRNINYNAYQKNDSYFNEIESSTIHSENPITDKDGKLDLAHMNTEGHEKLGKKILDKLTKKSII